MDGQELPVYHVDGNGGGDFPDRLVGGNRHVGEEIEGMGNVDLRTE